MNLIKNIRTRLSLKKTKSGQKFFVKVSILSAEDWPAQNLFEVNVSNRVDSRSVSLAIKVGLSHSAFMTVSG